MWPSKNILSPRKCYTEWSRYYFPSQKTATKCVALQKYSKSQKMYWMHCYTEQQGKLVTTSQSQRSELVFCQLAFLAEASKNSKLKQKTQGFGKIKNAVCRKSVEKKGCCSLSRTLVKCNHTFLIYCCYFLPKMSRKVAFISWEAPKHFSVEVVTIWKSGLVMCPSLTVLLGTLVKWGKNADIYQH